MTNYQLNDWRKSALRFEQQLNRIVIGQTSAVRHLMLAVFSRGHVLLEGNVGVGKTTLLRAVTHGLGGDYQRVEGTIDLMPADLIYYTYLDNNGKPRVDAGPLLSHGERLATFFFNEINRARPQVHALLLRAMAERSVSAFNQVYSLPYLQVFADRNRVEREETFELPAAAKDRFMFEISIDTPTDDVVLQELMFNPRYHDTDRLVLDMPEGQIAYYALNDVAAGIQQQIQSSGKLREYALALWKASHRPADYGIRLDDVDMAELILAGASPRGMSYFIRAAKTRAWLEGRDNLLPEDLQAVYQVTMAHRIFFSPMYAYRKAELMPEMINRILGQIAAP